MRIYLLLSDAHGCTDDPSLYYTDQRNIKCIDMKTYNGTYVSVKKVKTGLADARAIDIDHRERMIYWSDHEQWTINRMSLVTGDTEVICDTVSLAIHVNALYSMSCIFLSFRYTNDWSRLCSNYPTVTKP